LAKKEKEELAKQRELKARVAASTSFLLLWRFSSSSLCFSTSLLFLSSFFFSSAFLLLSSSCSFIPQNVFALAEEALHGGTGRHMRVVPHKSLDRTGPPMKASTKSILEGPVSRFPTIFTAFVLLLKTGQYNRTIQKSELKTKKQDRTIKESELKTNRHNRPIRT
jgi:hypothetical protein